MNTHHDLPTNENWLEDPTPPDFSQQEKRTKFPQDPDSESDSEVILKASSQSPEASDSEATFHTPPRSHPLWTEGSVGSACQVIEGKRPTFVTCRLERTHSLFSIFHPDHLVRERYPTLQERRNSLQSDSLDFPSYAVDLYFRSLVKYRQESQIPPPTWRGPPKQEGSHISPQGSPIHIQLPQPVTDTYKLVYMSCVTEAASFPCELM